MSRARRFEFGFIVLLLGILGLAAIDTAGFPFFARLFPLVAALIAFAATVVELVRVVRAPATSPAAGDGDGISDFLDRIRAGMPLLVALLAYYAAIYLFGFLVASGLFISLFLNLIARVRALSAALTGAVVIGWLIGISWLFVLEWPDGLLAPGIISGF